VELKCACDEVEIYANRDKQDIARTPSFPPELLPFPTQFTIPLSPTSSIKAVTDALSHYLLTLDLSRWTWHADSNTGIGEAPQNVWNRAYRRRREQAQQRQPRHKKRRTEDVSGDEEQAATHMDTEHEAEERERENPVALAFRIQIVDDEGPAVAKDSGNGTVAVVIDWLRGTDVLLWESFCGMVRRFVDGLPGVRPGHGAGGGATTKGGRDSAASGTKGEVLGSAGGNESVVTVLKRKRF
jgi:23S rRNA (adenine1618-N6)-methyltransferase